MTAASTPHPIAVIGAGFSGTMAALHLLPRIGSRAVLLCERGERFARGVAYGTSDPRHLLNVRAANMSAFPDRPDHFLDWLRTSPAVQTDLVHATEAGVFVSRALYGLYLTELLSGTIATAEGASRLIVVPDEVTDLVPEPGGFRVVLAGGNSHAVAAAVLAVGNLLPDDDGDDLYIANPWASPFARALHGDGPVVVIGTGLTMVDIALGLRSAGFPGPVVAISRRGLRPHTHAPAPPRPTPAFSTSERASPAQLLRRIRQEVHTASAGGTPWHSVVDSLRPITSDLWRDLPAAARDRFLRHARPWWDIHRHRMSPPVGKAVEEMLASGYLTIRAGHVAAIRPRPGGADVVLRPRGSAAALTLSAQRVINASGAVSPDRCGNPLLERLIASGLVRRNRHGLGLDQASDLAMLDAHGSRTPGLWGLGPIGAGAFWECVAVPDIRQQATRLAEAVASEHEAS